MSIRRIAAVAAAMATFVTTVVGLGAGGAWAVQTAQTTIVSADPSNWTPNVLDGKVEAIAQVGNTMLIGGTFTQLQQNTVGRAGGQPGPHRRLRRHHRPHQLDVRADGRRRGDDDHPVRGREHRSTSPATSSP